jgi:hypothetical protein
MERGASFVDGRRDECNSDVEFFRSIGAGTDIAQLIQYIPVRRIDISCKKKPHLSDVLIYPHIKARCLQRNSSGDFVFGELGSGSISL